MKFRNRLEVCGTREGVGERVVLRDVFGSQNLRGR
jgi:hypothetical protein